MKERPILFSGPMVRAILDGSKTQTRRFANTGLYAIDAQVHGAETAARELAALITKCPYGQPGDRLWVREAWAETRPCRSPWPVTMYVYRAGDNRTDYGGPWKPSIHMPRAACRIVLEVVSVRVERLNECSEADARAEGALYHEGRGIGHSGWRHDNGAVHVDARSAYARLWNDINGAGSWDANPWVWVVEFRRIAA